MINFIRLFTLTDFFQLKKDNPSTILNKKTILINILYIHIKYADKFKKKIILSILMTENMNKNTT